MSFPLLNVCQVVVALGCVVAISSSPGQSLAREALDEAITTATRRIANNRDAAPEYPMRGEPRTSIGERNAALIEDDSSATRNSALPGLAWPDAVALPLNVGPDLLGQRSRLLVEAVTRGPYLQIATPSGITIRWRTDVPTTSRVSYGTTLGSLNSSVEDPTLTTEHEVAITGLASGQRYYYAIGTMTTVLEGGDASHTFATLPPPGTASPTRIWVIGDAGTGTSEQIAVRDAWSTYNGGQPADVWLMLGDNAYESGLDAEYQSNVFDVYKTQFESMTLWPTRGNHDMLYGGANDDYYDIFSMPTVGQAGGLASGTEAYYSFDYGNVHFICLDSQGTNRSPSGAMATWLRDDLATTARDWVIAFWHHPPYTKGKHDSDDPIDSGGRMLDMRANILPILDSLGVDLVLCGHSHVYERSFLLNGHYDVSTTLADTMKVDDGDGRENGDGPYAKATLGTAPNEGCIYAGVGSSGYTSDGPLDHPVMVTSLNVLGSMVIDVDGSRLVARFIDDVSATQDSFTILKGPSGPKTYTWVGGAGPASWAAATNWDDGVGGARLVPAATDIMVINTTATINAIPLETIGQLLISGDVTVSLQAAAAAPNNALTIGGDDGTDFDVASGSTLNLNGGGATALQIVLAAVATGTVGGSIAVSGGGQRVLSGAAGALVFQNGSSMSTGTGFTGNVFGTTSPNAVIFQSGSVYAHAAGLHPFGATQPDAVVIFEAGSLYRQDGSQTPSFSGRTYADLEYNHGGPPRSAAGSAGVSIDNLTISQGTFNIGMTGVALFSLKGNVLVKAGATLTFNAASAGTITLNGTSAQTITNLGTFTSNNNETFNVDNANGVSLGSDLTIGTTTSGGGLSFTSGRVNTGAHTLTIASGANITGAGAGTGWVVGKLQRTVPISGTLGFDVGDGSVYAPVALQVNGVGAAFDVTASSIGSEHPSLTGSSIDPAKSVNRYWTLTPATTPTFTDYSATFNFASSDVDLSASPSNFNVRRYNGVTWFATTAGTRTATSTEATGSTSFSDFAVGELLHAITASAGAGGSISPSGVVSVNDGADQVFMITPNAGYEVEDVLVDNVSVGAVASHTFANVTADHTITASFAIGQRVVISQVYAGGGLSGSTYTHDFIELFNRGTATVDLTGWSVQRGAATGTTWSPLVLSGAIVPGGYYLIQERQGAGGTTPLPTPDAIGTFNLSAFGTKVALVSSTTALSGSCPGTATIVDLVGYGTANCFETAAGPGLTNTTAILRLSDGCEETDNNAADFVTGAPTPRNSAGPVRTCAYTLTASAGAGGSISPNGAVVVHHGDDQAFDITADPNRHIADVRVDGASVGAVTAFTFTNVSASHTIAATFAGCQEALALGADAYVDFGNPAALQTGMFTVELWFKRDGAGTPVNTGGVSDMIPLYTKGWLDTEDPAQDLNVALGISASTGVLCADFEEGAGGTTPSANHPLYGVSPVPTGSWHHAAVTYDGTRLRLYFDSVIEAAQIVSQPAASESNGPAVLGGALNVGGIPAGFFEGAMDEVRVWNSEASAESLRKAVNLELTAAQPNLVARWGMDECGGAMVHGSAGTTIDGAIVGSVYAWVSGAPFDVDVAPLAQVLSPNGGELLTVPGTATLTWSSTDETAVTAVDLLLSRTGPAGPFETIAAGLPDIKTYDWTIAGPPTTDAYLRLVVHDGTGHQTEDLSDAPFEIYVPTGVDAPPVGAFALAAVTPNPSREWARLYWEVPQASQVSIEILDLQGRRVTTVAEGLHAPGRYEAVWGARSNGRAAPGLYLVRMRTAGVEFVRRFVVIQ